MWCFFLLNIYVLKNGSLLFIKCESFAQKKLTDPVSLNVRDIFRLQFDMKANV